MDEPDGLSSSWLLRTHFSRAVCHRQGTCNPLGSWSTLPPQAACTPLLAEMRKGKDVHLAPFKKQHSLDSAPKASPCKETTELPDFSFPSPSSSSLISMRSDSPFHSKSTLDCLSPSSDEEVYSDSPHANSPPQPARRSCSAQSSFLHSIANTFSASSSRWPSTSSHNLNGSQEEHSPKCSSKGSWFSWISPKVSPMYSPKVSPAATPKGSPKGSPRSSFRYSTSTRDSYDQGDSVRSEKCSNMHRTRSWSQHLSNAGNERAVLFAEKWMVDLSQLLLEERFATGKNSRIYRGIYKESSVAVKVIQQPDEDSLVADRLEQVFTNEVSMLAMLNHRNIIKFVAACKKPPVLCVLTEYLSGGSLRSFLHKREGQLLPISEVLRMALDIAAGMEYLHMKGVIHRDLKSDNLVFGEDGCVKILDFGVSCFESHCDYKADDLGTYRWMAPEMLCHKPYTKMVDVYSFGIVLWELLTARLPYEEMGAVQAAFCVLHKNLRPQIPSDCPPALEDLMCRCWSTDPSIRPEFWEIMRELSLLEHSLDTSVVVTLESPPHLKSMPTWVQTK